MIPRRRAPKTSAILNFKICNVFQYGKTILTYISVAPIMQKFTIKIASVGI